MKRIFDGMFNHGELHFYPNTLIGKGAGVHLHAHDNPHVSLFYPGEPGWLAWIKKTAKKLGIYHWLGFVEYEVFAINSKGEHVYMPMDDWSFVYIEAGIDHLIKIKKGNSNSVGKFVCMFSNVNPDGSIRVDCKTSDHMQKKVEEINV